MNLFFAYASPLHNPLAQPEVYTAPLTAMKSTTGPAATALPAREYSHNGRGLYASPTRHTDGTRMRYYTQRKSLRHGAQHDSRKGHVTSHHGQRQELKMSSLALHVK